MKAGDKYQACVDALAAYAKGVGFSQVVIGLSGGIDSSVTAVMAVDAFGAKNVHGVLLPGPYSTGHSIDDALTLAENLGIESHLFPCEKALSGVEVAKLLQQDPDQTFKTLVTVAKSGEHYVFMVPVAEELDLKKAAAAVGEKAVSMLKSKELLPLTGYVHGGCSPVGMKKLFTTTIDETAQLFDTIMFSGGRIGCQVELAPSDLEKVIPLHYADITVS